MRTIGRSHLIRRLDKLEGRLRRKTQRSLGPIVWERLLRVMDRGDPGAVRRALEDLPTWQTLVPTMDPEHVAIALDVFANEDWVRETTGRCNLARIICHALAREWDGPLTLPRAVADLYLHEPETLPLHSCVSCGYRIPTYIGPGSERRPAYFAQCPLCSGRIRWESVCTSESPVGPDGCCEGA